MPASFRPVRIQPFLATLGFLLLLRQAVAQGQSLSQGALQGEIALATGAGVSDASVTIEDEAGANIRGLTTDARGLFTIPLMTPGNYAILVEKTGFQPFRQRGVVVLANQQTSLRIVVTRRPPPITSVEESTAPNQAFLPGSPRVTEVLGGRDFERGGVRLDLADVGRFSTGVVAPGIAGWGFGDVVGSLPQGQSRLTLDGLSVFSLRHPGVEIAPAGMPAAPPFLLQEARLVAAGADGEFPSAPGGAVNVVSRAPTRRFRFEPFASWGASPGLASEQDPADSGLKNLQVGAVISSALVKDRAQFLVGGVYQVLDLPSASPWTRDSAVLGGGTVPLGGTIERIATDTYGANASGGTRPRVRSYRGGAGTVVVGWQLSPVHRLTTRAAGARYRERNPLLGLDVLNGGDASLDAKDFLGSATLTSSWSDVSNELRVGFQSATRDWRAKGPATTYFVSDAAGIGAPATAPGYFKLSAVHLTDAVLYQFGPAGEHRMKLGLAYTDGTWKQDYVHGRRGTFQFGDLTHFQAGDGVFSDVLTGRSAVSFRVREIGLFGDLQFRFGSGLTGVAGIRWDRQKFPTDALVGDTTFVQAFGIRSDRTPDDNINLSPRLGILWNGGRSRQWLVSLVGALDHGLLNPQRFAEVVLNTHRMAVRRSIGAFPAWPVPPDTLALPPGGRRFALFGGAGDFHDPRTAKLDLEITRRFPSGFSARLTGRYHHTDFLLRRSDLNLQQTPTGLTQEGRAVYGQLVQSGGLVVGSPGTSRRLTSFDLVSGFSSTGAQDFYEAVVRLAREFGRGIEMSAAYSISQARDNWLQSWTGDPADELSPFPAERLDGGWARGVSDFDIPQRVMLSASWHSSGRIGVSVSGRFRYQSGFPFTPGFQPGVDANGDGSGRNDPAFLDPTIPGLPSLVPRHECLRGQVARFARRNSCREPGRHALDLGAAVALPVRSLGGHLEATLDVINLVSSRAGVVDRALVLVDPAGTLVTDASGNVTLPLAANPRFGKLLSRRDEPRIVRLGFRLGNW